jgi:hypothetical protein
LGIRLALAQLNTVVGDLDGNGDRIRAGLEDARKVAAGVDDGRPVRRVVPQDRAVLPEGRDRDDGGAQHGARPHSGASGFFMPTTW